MNQLGAEMVAAIHHYSKKGFSLRRIAKELGIHRATVSKYLRYQRWPKLERSPTGPKSSCLKFEKIILKRLRSAETLLAIHHELQTQYDFNGGYSSVRRFARKLRTVHNIPKVAEIQRNWVVELLSGTWSDEKLCSLFDSSDELKILRNFLRNGQEKERKKAVTVLARKNGISNSTVANAINIHRRTTRRYYNLYLQSGAKGLFDKRQRGISKVDQPLYRDAVVAILHAPPSDFGINRTTWKQEDLKRVIQKENGLTVSRACIRKILKNAGYRWLKARRVLTSTDPCYREKLQQIQNTLSNMSDDERFFSIDEYGPFSITQKPGKKLVPPGEAYTIPQYQKSKGRLILTAALELCTNQITHFYSEKKNTTEMIRLLDILLEEYSNMRTIYLSWDAASWHMSKKFHSRVAEVNLRNGFGLCPRVELIPLPACAQFLNVIESVFSGLARAIIHNSNYPCVDAAKLAIDSYFTERNRFFQSNPKRAGNKIWGKERTPPVFSESNTCKDARYR